MADRSNQSADWPADDSRDSHQPGQVGEWLRQAAEARVLAKSFESLEARRQMLSIASAYERLANFASVRIGAQTTAPELKEEQQAP